MLFCDQFDNFEDFKSRFGFKTGLDGHYLVNANGVKQRKNNIVYLYWKEQSIMLHKKGRSLSAAYREASKYDNAKDVFKSMLRQVYGTTPENMCPVASFEGYNIKDSGVCIDGDVNSIRYSNSSGKVYKMKIGKFISKYFEYLQKIRKLPFWAENPTLRIFFIEELTELWKNKRLKEQSMKVVVDKDFHSIYNTSKRPKGGSNFGSCMDGDSNWHFYKAHPNVYEAISLRDDDGLIYARAILVHCFDQDNNPHTYIERIYCNKRMYKDLLFEKAKAAGIFDLYKGLEASCHEYDQIYSVNDPKHRINYYLYVQLDLHGECYMSYQDTFKWYYSSTGRAYNTIFNDKGRQYGLATTETYINFPS